MHPVNKTQLRKSQSAKAIAYAASYPSSEERQQYTFQVAAAVITVALAFFAFSAIG